MSKFDISVEYFDPTIQEWARWIARFDNYLVAANVTADVRKRALLLHFIGPGNFNTFEMLPNKGMTYVQAKEALKNYFLPSSNSEFERSKFRKLQQNKSESIDVYHIRLREQADKCDFHDISGEIKSHIIQSTTDSKLRKFGLKTGGCTLDELLLHGRTNELATKQSNEMENCDNTSSSMSSRSGETKADHSVNKITQSKQCNKCGSTPGHTASQCPASNRICYRCSRVGHYATQFYSKSRNSSRGRNNQRHNNQSSRGGNRRRGNQTGSTRARARCVNQTERGFSDDSDSDHSMFVLSNNKIDRSHFKTILNVNDVNLEMLIDTQADDTIMSIDTYNKYFSHIKIDPDVIPLKTYSDWLNVVKLDWSKITQNLNSRNVNSLQKDKGVNLRDNSQLQAVLKEHAQLFVSDKKGITGEKVHINMKQNVQPIYCKARFVPYAMKSKVERELVRLENEHVLTKVETSNWASPIVVVPKSDGTVRICGDYSVTINQHVTDEEYSLPSADSELSGKRVFTKLDLSHAYTQLNI
ncbi:uncharacterized protein [Antedon mediterranea]|uniref:uncharacterized protein n=1 Tax=Antedon mediterranea TaxID=105859 RepID=UPI003AF6DD9A